MRRAASRSHRRTTEIARNPRARSARLRWGVRTDAPPPLDLETLGLPRLEVRDISAWLGMFTVTYKVVVIGRLRRYCDACCQFYVLFGVMVGLLMLIYQQKHETRQLESRAGELSREIAEQTRALSVLRAEWTYLTRPERLERIAREQLGLEPVAAHADQVLFRDRGAGARRGAARRRAAMSVQPKTPPRRAAPMRCASASCLWRWFAVFTGLTARLIALGTGPEGRRAQSPSRRRSRALARPDLVDRKGRMLATDLQVYWAYGDPARVVDVDEAAEKLARVLPEQDPLRNCAKSSLGDGRFVWLYRGLTPKQARGCPPARAARRRAVHGEPACLSRPARQACMCWATPNRQSRHCRHRGTLTARANIAQPAASPDERAQVRLSLDLGLQHVLRDELREARAMRYDAKAVAGLIMDVHSGEVLALTSLPDYDPNRREESLKARSAEPAVR